ncbi:glycerate kinase, partial [Actinomyces sp. MRS3W]|uniref:glycerate kinase n=1 Tax=Actinomyces sp. MRS3W TaxID=2800796 RepID=UPI002905F60F
MYPEPGGIPVVAPGLGLGADAVAVALAEGWAHARPDDVLTLLPLPDGGPGTAQAVSDAHVVARTVLHAPGPLGQIREVDLLRLQPAQVPPAAQAPAAQGTTWFLDAARLVALPADRRQAEEEAESGTTTGLGQVLATALQET